LDDNVISLGIKPMEQSFFDW